MIRMQEILDLIDALPIDDFVICDDADGYYVDLENMDASDYVDNCGAFNKAMCMAAVLRDRINEHNVGTDPFIEQREDRAHRIGKG